MWQCIYFWAGDIAFASPTQTITQLLKLFQQEKFWLDLMETGKAVALSMLLSSMIGIPLGIAMGRINLLGETLVPIVLGFASVPKITLYPFILLVFGLGISAKVCFGVMHGFVPILLFTINGVHSVRKVHIKTAAILKLSAFACARLVWLPSAYQDILSGLRIGLSSSILGVLIGEMFASSFGIGSSLMMAVGLNDPPAILALIAVISVFAIGLNLLFLGLRRESG